MTSIKTHFSSRSSDVILHSQPQPHLTLLVLPLYLIFLNCLLAYPSSHNPAAHPPHMHTQLYLPFSRLSHAVSFTQVLVTGALSAAAPPTGRGFRSRSSAELVGGISPGSASGHQSPHAPLVHNMTPYGPVCPRVSCIYLFKVHSWSHQFVTSTSPCSEPDHILVQSTLAFGMYQRLGMRCSTMLSSRGSMSPSIINHNSAMYQANMPQVTCTSSQTVHGFPGAGQCQSRIGAKQPELQRTISGTLVFSPLVCRVRAPWPACQPDIGQLTWHLPEQQSHCH